MSDNKYVLSEEADFDLEDIFEYTNVKFDFSQAISYLTEIEDVFNKLATTPTMGRTRNEIKEELRSFPINEHVIFYRIMTGHIRIVRVLYGGRDLPKQF